MEQWIVYGLLTALLMGVFPALFKILTDSRYFGVNTNTVAILVWVGMGIVFIGYSLYGGKLSLPSNIVLIIGLLTGVIVGISLLLRIIAIGFGADVTRFVPLYNTNSLFAAIIGIVTLGELPDTNQAIKVIVGAILIIIGGVWCLSSCYLYCWWYKLFQQMNNQFFRSFNHTFHHGAS